MSRNRPFLQPPSTVLAQPEGRCTRQWAKASTQWSVGGIPGVAGACPWHCSPAGGWSGWAFNAPPGCRLDFSPLRVSLHEMLMFMFFLYWELKPRVQNVKKSPSGVYFQSFSSRSVGSFRVVKYLYLQNSFTKIISIKLLPSQFTI